ncbi:MAG TPA: maleylpyruvate isomerase family mycothiol-dependent enzyme [Streptosporangiaceae bacterium]|nr:maleylpyruvate isomerase family mycothiol-dependent enzyme [Streptosporangiaceae bacterium]
MARIDVWPAVFAERKSLVADLADLPADGWDKQSLCTQWTVRDVLAHMTATAKITPPLFFAKMAANGFSFAKLQAKDIAAERGGSSADTLAGFKSVAESTKRPPGPIDTMLGETIVHSEDIRRALGIKHDYPPEALTQVADFFKASNLIIGTKRRIDGLTLRATDVTWTHGSGPEVSGPMLPLLMAMTGRKPALDDLSGDGVAILRTRP